MAVNLNRRSFLAGAAGIAAGALLPGCATSGSREFVEQLQRTASSYGGTLSLPDSPTYATARLPWNARFDDVFPLAVYRPRDAAGVAAAVKVARDSGVDFRIRGGRHSFAGFSTSPGLIVDTSGLTAVDVDLTAGVVRAGAGLTNLALYRQLAPRGYAFVGGTCPTVGVAGLALGGGFGRMSQSDGVTSDSVTELNVVLADGTQRRVSEQQDSELFWGLRGGAGGNFAAVTDLTFRLVPTAREYTTWTQTFAWDSAVDLMIAWQQWITELPRNAHSELSLQNGTTGCSANLSFVYAGAYRDGARLLNELHAAVSTKPATSSHESGGFFFSQKDAYCHGLSIEECSYQELSDAGQLPRGAMTANSDFANEPWPQAGIETAVAHLERRQADPLLTPGGFNPSLQMGKWLMESTGGRTNEISPTATAFAHRSSIYVATYQARWLADATEEQEAANLAWLADWYAAVRPWRSGAAYQNYPNPHQDDWLNAYYGPNVTRLQQLKRVVDPDDVFRFPQSIPLP